MEQQLAAGAVNGTKPNSAWRVSSAAIPNIISRMAGSAAVHACQEASSAPEVSCTLPSAAFSMASAIDSALNASILV